MTAGPRAALRPHRPRPRLPRRVGRPRSPRQLMGIGHRARVSPWPPRCRSPCVAVAGIFLAFRTTVAASDGPGYLLYAFEAVIIGGMGSFWGTFGGGVILGVAQAVGFRFDPGWGILVGHLACLAVLLTRPRGPLPAHAGLIPMPDPMTAHPIALTAARGLWGGAALTCFLATLPWWADASTLRLVVEAVCLLVLAQMWNLLAGYGGLVSVGQQALCRDGRLYPRRAGRPGRPQSVPLRSAGRPGRRAGGGARVADRVPPPGRLLRHRHLGHRGGVPPRGGERLRARRRLWPKPRRHARVSQGAPRVADLLGRACAAGGGDGGALLCCCARVTAWRSPRCATARWRRRARASTWPPPSSWSTRWRRSEGMRGGALLPDEPAHLTRRAPSA